MKEQEKAQKEWELEQLAKELGYKLVKIDEIDTPEQNDVCEHNFEMGYCVVEGCEGGI